MYKLLYLILLYLKCILSSNILFISSTPTTSHNIWNREVGVEFVKRGHNLTMLRTDKSERINLANYTEILIEGVLEELFKLSGSFNEMGKSSPAKNLLQLQLFSKNLCEAFVKSKGTQDLLKYPPDFKFDLIIFAVARGRCLYPFISKFNYPPSIGITPLFLTSFLSFNFGKHVYPAYVPWYGFPYTTKMSFLERTWNFIMVYFEIYLRHYWADTIEQKLANQIFGKNMPSLNELEQRISLLMPNVDPVLNYPQPISPNIIPVGGLVAKNSKPISQDLKNILDDAKLGAIIFSLGTGIRSDMLDKSVQEEIINAFSQIPQTVLWKFESDIKNLPKNIIVRAWFSQNDLLGHPNVKLFIGHGGSLSTQEAIFQGVPVMLIPFFQDQHVIAKNIVSRKLGVSINLKNITTEIFLQNLREVLGNPSYLRNMRTVSTQYKDIPETALERAVFWSEYVLRHKGAESLSGSTRTISFCEWFDFYLYFTLVLSIVIFVFVYKLCKLK